MNTSALPDPWQLHLYGYAADLTVGGTGHAIRPDDPLPGRQLRLRLPDEAEPGGGCGAAEVGGVAEGTGQHS